MRRMGNIIGSVIAAIALMTIFAFVLASSSVFHIRMSAHVGASQRAADCAEAALADTCNQISQALQDSQSKGTAFSLPTTITEKPEPGATTIVTFDAATASTENMYVSYFNPQTATPSPTVWPAPAPPVSPQYQIPANGVALCAKATVSGERRLAVALIEWPDFVYALASSGRIQTTSGTVVEEEDAQGNIIPNAGDVGSNSTDANPASVALSAGDIVGGNAESLGDVSAPNGVIDGAVVRLVEPIALPSASTSSLAPPSDLTPATYAAPANMPSLPITNAYVSIKGDPNNSNNVTMSSLDLNNGVVMIQGNLVANTVTGTGVVLVTGTCTISNQASLGSSDEVALASDGDLSLTGGGSRFRGSVYTGGNFKANNVTVEGVFIANAPNNTGNGGSKVSLTSVKVIGNPRLSHQSFSGINPAPQIVPSGTTDVLNPQGSTTPMTIYRTSSGQYWIAQMPNTPPQNEANFWNQTVVQYTSSLGFTISGTGNWAWWNNPNPSSQPHAQDMSEGGTWENFHHFLQYATSKEYTGSTGGTTTGSSGGKFDYNLNRFISPFDQVRVLMWKVL